MRAPALTFARARRLRRGMSLPEVLLWDCLRAGCLEGLRFRRQHPVGPYVLDFYCPEAKLAVEVDGAHHELAGQMGQNRRRDQWLSEQGVRTLRFPATDILNERSLEGALVMIAQAAGSVGKPPPPPPPAVPLPRKRVRTGGGDGLDRESSPALQKSLASGYGRDPGSSLAKRGRGTAEGGGGGEASRRGSREVGSDLNSSPVTLGSVASGYGRDPGSSPAKRGRGTAEGGGGGGYGTIDSEPDSSDEREQIP